MNKKIKVWKKVWGAEEGYFTVEATFLVTMAFLLVSVVVLTALYICDLNQAKGFLNQRVIELSLDGDSSYGSESLSEDKSRIRQQLFITKITDFLITKTEKQVKGKLSLSMKINIPMIGDGFGSIWTDTFSLTVNIGDNVEMMRRWEQLE